MRKTSNISKKAQKKPGLINFDNPIYFYLVKKGSRFSLERDFKIILDQLGTQDDVELTKTSDISYLILFKETQNKSHLKMSLPDRFVLECDKYDNVSISILKYIVTNLGYRIFDPTIESYMVNDQNLIDLTTTRPESKLYTIFANNLLYPLFQYRNSNVFYAKNLATGRIHLVNRHLLALFLEKNINMKTDVISTPVAKNLGEFVALFDRGLIPTSFYEAFYHPSQIINLSGFSSKKTNEEMFVAPLFFELDLKDQSFKLSENFNNGRKDLLPKNSSLIKYIAVLLAGSTINIKFLVAKFFQDISYEIVSPEKITPRLNISIYFEREGVEPLN